MHPGHIANSTRTLSAPQDWNKAVDGACGSLVIRDERNHSSYCMTSAWFPTPPELQRILMGAPVYLTIMGKVHPVVLMSVGPSPD